MARRAQIAETVCIKIEIGVGTSCMLAMLTKRRTEVQNEPLPKQPQLSKPVEPELCTRRADYMKMTAFLTGPASDVGGKIGGPCVSEAEVQPVLRCFETGAPSRPAQHGHEARRHGYGSGSVRYGPRNACGAVGMFRFYLLTRQLDSHLDASSEIM
eukprot:4018945-Pleurochrysis_carterae.AAC.3